MKKLRQNIDVFSNSVMTRLSNGYVYHKDHTLNCLDFQFYKAFPLIWYFVMAVLTGVRLFDFYEIMLRPKTGVVSAIGINH